MKQRIGFAVALIAAASAVSAAEVNESRTFTEKTPLAGMVIEGKVTVDRTRDRKGAVESDTEDWAALKIEPNGSVTWTLREGNGSGKVELWIYEDGAVASAPKGHGAGAMWGLLQADGPTLTLGALYAPYLSGDKHHAMAEFDPGEAKSASSNVQWLGVPREPGWHKWTFEFDPDKGLGIFCDDAEVRNFKWNKTKLLGFNGIVLYGDTTDAGQVLWVDDLQATLGPEPNVKPVWPPPPPPPPADLVPIESKQPQPLAPYKAWAKGPGQSPDYFPIGLWMQVPENAERYKEMGFNLYVALWKGPTEKQIRQLQEAGMPVVCNQNDYAKAHLDEEIIVGWMHGDEPDNAQSVKDFWKEDTGRMDEAWPEYAGRKWGAWGPPRPPADIVTGYEEIRVVDLSRPVMLNLGQGLAYDKWGGRGVRCNHPEDYPDYIKGSDIVSFDIYPSTEGHPEIGMLWRVPFGINRMREWTDDGKIPWNIIGVHPHRGIQPTAHQVKAMAWLSIIYGSRGLVYHVHQYQPEFLESVLLPDSAEGPTKIINPEMVAMVTAINGQITQLARVINSPTISAGVRVGSSTPETPVPVMVKQHDGATYIFACAMHHKDTSATFASIAGITASHATAEVLGEDREIIVRDGNFGDEFKGYGVHIYKILPLQ